VHYVDGDNQSWLAEQWQDLDEDDEADDG